MTRHRDPFLLSVAEAAALLGKGPAEMRKALNGDWADVKANVPGAFEKVNLLALCRKVYADDAERQIPIWRECVDAMREVAS